MNDGNTEQSNESVGDLKDAPQNSPARPPERSTAQRGLLRKVFWLDDKLAQAEQKGFSKSQPGWAEFELSRQARAGIVQIGETGEGNAAVLLLERAEVLFLIRSHLARRTLAPACMALSADDWSHARELPAIAEVWAELSGAQQSAVEVGLGEKAELAIVELDLKQRRYLASGLRKLAAALSEPLEREASLIGRVLFMRWARIGAALLVLLGIVFAITGSVEKRFAKPNLALGRPVTVSSQFPDAGLDHTLLVDGDRTNLGFHTDNSPNQWVTIDLGASKSISKVVVYNRAECCQERAVPLRLEVSDDNVNYRKVADRTEEFDVWTAKGLDAKGRYVRLRHLGANFLHLAEVEIF
jgi:hypothetical protein